MAEFQFYVRVFVPGVKCFEE